ncbi:FMRFamide receptor [Strongyloides ratti]|uniref:FMRFamide receptor n=1 Tax=Strongyloides ratti TaxID=34506 RepID=A0A090KX44_STRRB|nr:FMRFamide receptor [Strongyloides ratti]CEF59797.1 FMRFamide receptor [Strongyloides ratti]
MNDSIVIDTPLPYCNICLPSTDPKYQAYNIAVSGILLAFVGIVGFFGNILVIRVYTTPNMRKHSSNIYLAALGTSDLLMICTAMFLFVLESWRHHSRPIVAYIYGFGAPYIFPLGAIFQTTSVYFCVAAAVDCFIRVVLPKKIGDKCCTAKIAERIVIVITIICLIYNIPHFFELQSVLCIDTKYEINNLQICPTDFRTNEIYYTIYYTFLYTTFMAVGPLIVLVILNICVVVSVCSKSNTIEEDDGIDEEDGTISLILVVFFFIFCNFIALIVNFLELIFQQQLEATMAYLIDMSNLLVVINCTANFFVYLIFSPAFKRTLKEIIFTNKVIKDEEEIWKESCENGSSLQNILD